MKILKLRSDKIGWKAVRSRSGRVIIVKLRIPKGAKVFSRWANSWTEIGEKARAEQARVLSMRRREDNRPMKLGYSTHDPSFIYRPGKVVRPEFGFCESYSTCTNGIHFFRSKKQAEEYLS